MSRVLRLSLGTGSREDVEAGMCDPGGNRGTVQQYRDGGRKAKACLEFNLVCYMKGSNKELCKYISSKRSQGKCGLAPTQVRGPCWQGTEKPSNVVFTSRTCLAHTSWILFCILSKIQNETKVILLWKAVNKEGPRTEAAWLNNTAHTARLFIKRPDLMLPLSFGSNFKVTDIDSDMICA